MELLEIINTDTIRAMKAKQNAKLSTLRLLKSALKNKQIELLHELSDDDVLAVVKSQIKQLKDSLESFESAGRTEMAAAAKQEIELLSGYLPAQLSDEELEKIVKEALASMGAVSSADMGKAMGGAMKAVAGRADGSRVKAAVQSLLAGLVLFLLSVSVAQAASPETVNFVVPAIKITRVFLILIGIFFINTLLLGGFTFMTASMRNDVQGEGMQKMSLGIMGSLVVASLFAIATVALEKIN